MHCLSTVEAAAAVHFVRFAAQAAAHETPLPGAKQLARAVSNSVWQLATLDAMLHIFCCVAASFRQAVVAGLNVADGGSVVVVVAVATTRRATSSPTALRTIPAMSLRVMREG